MKSFFSILTIGLIVIGFVAPIAWIGAVITAIIAIGSAPASKRADGKARTGGLLGGLWDDYQVSRTMTDCPFCKSKIVKEASKCPNCGEWVKAPSTLSQGYLQEKEFSDSQDTEGILSKIGFLEATIIILVGVIIISYIVGKFL